MICSYNCLENPCADTWLRPLGASLLSNPLCLWRRDLVTTLYPGLCLTCSLISLQFISFYFLGFFFVFHSVFLSICTVIWALGMTKWLKKICVFWALGPRKLQVVTDSDEQHISTWVRAPSGRVLVIISGLCNGQIELCDQCNEFSSRVMIFCMTTWKSGLWKPKREALQKRPPKLEQSNTETVSSSTNVLLCFAGWVGEH